MNPYKQGGAGPSGEKSVLPAEVVLSVQDRQVFTMQTRGRKTISGRDAALTRQGPVKGPSRQVSEQNQPVRPGTVRGCDKR